MDDISPTTIPDFPYIKKVTVQANLKGHKESQQRLLRVSEIFLSIIEKKKK